MLSLLEHDNFQGQSLGGSTYPVKLGYDLIKETQSCIESDPMIQGAQLIGNEERQILKREQGNLFLSLDVLNRDECYRN